MNVQEQIKNYIASQPEPKRSEMQALHDMILEVIRHVSYGSWMVKTMKVKLFLIRISDMDLATTNTLMGQSESFIRSV